ncbi:MAG: aldose 1-epimerase [Rhizobiales bacterium]|nr:aldose 1-epimerase [Hyphomicrobiales bacterium]
MIDDPCRADLASGPLQATILPGYGMLVASLKWQGIEQLRRIDELETAAAKGSTAGIPVLYPWANRLDGLRYHAAGREVVLDPNSPLLHFDGNGLPIHGVPWAQLPWQVMITTPSSITASLDWAGDLLSVFPFPHRVEMEIGLGDGLSIAVTVIAKDEPVPVSFGFHPYFGLSDVPRADWHLHLPAMQELTLDARGIPTGAHTNFAARDDALGDTFYDNGFALAETPEQLALSGAGRGIAVEFVQGFPFAQVYAPKGQDLVALEPMTAPTNALVSGKDLPIMKPGERFAAKFRVTIS